MSQDIFNLLIGATIALVSTLFTTIVSAVIQSRKDEREHRWQEKHEISKRWWERKADAYGGIINDLVLFTNEQQTLSEFRAQFSPEEKIDSSDPIFTNYIKLCSRLEGKAREGAYLITEKSAQELQKFIATLEIFPDFEDGFLQNAENRYIAASSCLEIIRQEAKKDLGISDLQPGTHN